MTPPDLSIRQREAAVLDAAGFSKDSIAATLGVSPKSVSNWRGDERYKTLVEEYEKRQAAEIEPIIQRIQMDLAVTVVKAVRTIDRAMDAKDGDGNPSWKIQLDAAISALSHAKLISPETLEGEKHGTPHAAIIKVELPEISPPKPKAIESTASEE